MRVLREARASLGEGPVWDVATQRLYWVDIDRGHLHIVTETLSSAPEDIAKSPDRVIDLSQFGKVGVAVPSVNLQVWFFLSWRISPSSF